MRKCNLIIFILMMMILSSCGIPSEGTNSKNLNYEILDDTVNGYKVVRLTVKEDLGSYCKATFVKMIEVDDVTEVYFDYGCMGDGYFLLVLGEYVDFLEAVSSGYITATDAMNSGIGRVHYSDTIFARIELYLTDFTVFEVKIHELNDELALDGSGQWDTSYNLDLELQDIFHLLTPLTNKRVTEDDFCIDTSCIQLKSQAPIQIHLESSTHNLTIHIYEDYIDLLFTNVNEIYYIYNLSDTEDNASKLFEFINELHKDSNK